MTTTRTVLACAAALLDQGRTVDRLSQLLTAAALIGLLLYAAVIQLPERELIACLIATALAGCVEVYLAIRVAFDSALFHQLATGSESPDFSDLDRSLTELGLLPATKHGRPTRLRIDGAMRLMRLQVLAVVAQVVALAGGGLTMMWR